MNAPSTDAFARLQPAFAVAHVPDALAPSAKFFPPETRNAGVREERIYYLARPRAEFAHERTRPMLAPAVCLVAASAPPALSHFSLINAAPDERGETSGWQPAVRPGSGTAPQRTDQRLRPARHAGLGGDMRGP